MTFPGSGIDDCPPNPLLPKKDKIPLLPPAHLGRNPVSDALTRRLVETITLGDFYPNEDKGTCSSCKKEHVETYPLGSPQVPVDICKTCLKRRINQARMFKIGNG